jgi:hypothetical protein
MLILSRWGPMMSGIGDKCCPAASRRVEINQNTSLIMDNQSMYCISDQFLSRIMLMVT